MPVTLGIAACVHEPFRRAGGRAARFLQDSARAGSWSIHDELDLPFGEIRLKLGGGAGGHNGLRSVTAALGSPDYFRVRFGIGRPPGRMDPADFVLRDFTAAERKELPLLIERAADAVEALLRDGLEPRAERVSRARPRTAGRLAARPRLRSEPRSLRSVHRRATPGPPLGDTGPIV